MKRDTRTGGEGISVYFWPSNTSVDALPAAVAAAAGSAPPYVLTGANATAEDLAKWGQPAAHFDNGASCDMSQYFEEHEIIINLTFCGDWAGETFQSSGCGPQSCSSFVRSESQHAQRGIACTDRHCPQTTPLRSRMPAGSSTTSASTPTRPGARPAQASAGRPQALFCSLASPLLSRLCPALVSPVPSCYYLPA